MKSNGFHQIGVVGRTGAGKSSLLLALLRFLRSSQGRILVDDVDIAQVPLQRLRSAITIIPQVSPKLKKKKTKHRQPA